MTTETALTKAEAPIDLALLKAVGLDRLAPEQRQLALNIAQRYELDLLMKHLVMIEGRPYITRDGLLHVAHRSGQLDGMETTELAVVDGFWRSTCSVFRKDMGHPFRYTARYPTTGGNQKFAPEMAVKVGEVMALRRAFDVAAPVIEERWDIEVPAAEPVAKPSLAERAAAKATEIAHAPRVEILNREDDGFTALVAAAPPIITTNRPGGILNAEEVAEGAPPVYAEPPVSAGLSVETLKDLCVKAGKSTVAIAKVLEIGPDLVGARVKAMSPAERGELADAMGIPWGAA